MPNTSNNTQKGKKAVVSSAKKAFTKKSLAKLLASEYQGRETTKVLIMYFFNI
jgi:hypothetical protein